MKDHKYGNVLEEVDSDPPWTLNENCRIPFLTPYRKDTNPMYSITEDGKIVRERENDQTTPFNVQGCDVTCFPPTPEVGYR